ncbi:MAG: hypothetical protein WAR76_19825, partial [Xanthobacteraceae bacterium]
MVIRTNEGRLGAFPQFATQRFASVVGRFVFPRAGIKKQNLFPRGHLALAAMNDGCDVGAARLPAQQARRPSARDRAT